jgi:N utilization substance protein B
MSRRVPPSRSGRSAARLLAVQALYQMDLAQADVNETVEEFVHHRFAGDADAPALAEPDEALFSGVVRGVVAHQERLDKSVARCLAQGWTLARIDSILRAVLRSAAYELLDTPAVPARVVISEYLEVTHAFFDGEEASFVNGVLDRLARSLRAAEFAAPGASGHDGAG